MTQSPITTTLCFILSPRDGILLGRKITGHGKGKWNGFGGKCDPGESVEDAMVREVREESGIQIRSYHKKAVIHFTYPRDPVYDQSMHVYISQEWEGKSIKTAEMLPRWFAHEDIPYDTMWPDDRIWLPYVLKGRSLHASFTLSDQDTLSGYTIEVHEDPEHYSSHPDK